MELDVYALVLIQPQDDPPEPATLDIGGFFESLSSRVYLDTSKVEHADFIIDLTVYSYRQRVIINVSRFPYAEPTPVWYGEEDGNYVVPQTNQSESTLSIWKTTAPKSSQARTRTALFFNLIIIIT